MADTIKINTHLLEKYNVKLYDTTDDNYDIINDHLENNLREQPFYIVNFGTIVKLYEHWNELLPNIKPYYAVKCNPNVVLIELLASLGCNFDCASENEIRSVIQITNDPDRIIFANPCKMSSQIKYARANDVDLMTFDCEEELYKIKLYHPYSKLVLRIAVDDSHSKCQFNSKFGCKIEDVDNIIILMKTLKLNLYGISFHVGSGCESVDSYYNAIKDVRNVYDIAVSHGNNISLIDIGGGFNGNLTKEPGKILFKDVATVINNAMTDFFKDEIDNNKIEIIAEPGRYFAEKSHILVLNVIGKKKQKNKDNEEIIIYYLNDGIYGSFNCIIFDHQHPIILPFNERNEEMVYKSIIFGPTCDSIDVIAKNIMLPELAIGEWVYVEDFGAYTTAASSSFNGFNTIDYMYIYQ